MSANNKQSVSIRLNPKLYEHLKTLAKEGVTVSYLINQAVQEFLDGKTTESAKDRSVVAEEVEAVIPVLKLIGKPIHVDLFFELIETQQGR